MTNSDTPDRRRTAALQSLRPPMTLLSGWLLAVLVVGCTTGSGNIVTETRDVDEFDRLDVSSGIVVDLSVGSPPNVASTFDDNVQDKIRTEVVDGTLIIEANGSFTVTGSGRMVEVDVPSLTAMVVSGGARVEGSGSVEQLSVEADGGSSVDLSDLIVQTMDVVASAGANLQVNAETSIEGEVSGGANLTVNGDPSTRNLDVSGGGTVSG